jgi:TonB family protein
VSAIRGLVQSEEALADYLARFAEYHPSALFERYAPPSQRDQPETVEESAREERIPITVSRRYRATYPERAWREKLFGLVRLGAWLHADGRLSDVHVIESVPKNVFDTESVEAFRRWRFDPSDDPTRLNPVFVTQIFDFSIPGAEFPADSPIVKRYHELLEKGASDDLALFQAGNLDRYFDFDPPVDRADHLAASLRLAAANLPMAARRLAWACDAASDCRTFWLRRAAIAGDARAQFWLSRQIEPLAPGLAEDLLRSSVAGGMPSAAVKRLYQLLASPETVDLGELAMVVDQLPASSKSELNPNYVAATELLKSRE